MAGQKPKPDFTTPAGPQANSVDRLFGRKKGKKLRPSRQALVDAALPRLAIDLNMCGEENIDPSNLFPEPVKSVWLEVGFGGGEHLLAQARANPEVGFIGCEPFLEGAAKTIVAIEAEGLRNIRLLIDDARLLMAVLPDACLERLFLLFPDPWHKKRHHKRRFINATTVAEVARLLSSSGEWRIASDIMEYVDWSLRALAKSEFFCWTARQAADWRHRPLDWPATRYEEKALRQNRTPVYLSFVRK